MKRTTKRRSGKPSRKNLWIGAIAVIAAFALLIAYATAANTNVKPSAVQYQEMGGMMSGLANQGVISECNNIMAHDGISQAAINSMDRMMSGGGAQMMQSHAN